MVLLPSPNNPTGTSLPLDTRGLVAAATAEVGGVVVIDEAYGEFRRSGTPSALELLPTTPNLVVSRTMSKAFALAGARLGYLAASTEIVDALRVVRLPYHLSAVTQAVALAALRHTEELLGRVDELRAERDRTVGVAAGARAPGGGDRCQLRVVRDVPRPACCLAGPARPRGADPGDRARRLVAGVDRQRLTEMAAFKRH